MMVLGYVDPTLSLFELFQIVLQRKVSQTVFEEDNGSLVNHFVYDIHSCVAIARVIAAVASDTTPDFFFPSHLSIPYLAFCVVKLLSLSDTSYTGIVQV
jgi:hypothetical protein